MAVAHLTGARLDNVLPGRMRNASEMPTMKPTARILPYLSESRGLEPLLQLVLASTITDSLGFVSKGLPTFQQRTQAVNSGGGGGGEEDGEEDGWEDDGRILLE